MSSLSSAKFDLRRWVALVIFCIGVIGSAYAFHIQPKNYDIIFDTTRWLFCSLFSTIAFFVGWAGLRRTKLTTYHLKIIDLMWVLASAVAVGLAAVQATQVGADSHRAIIKHNIEQSRSVARSMIREAYTNECLTRARLDASQCESMRRLGISLEADGYLSPSVVGAICPHPIRVDAPPPNFGPALIQGCINAGYAAYAADDPVLIDESNVGIWRLYAGFWPHLMILLVSLRVAKSAAEVLWEVK
jgi:hypothetical protein